MNIKIPVLCPCEIKKLSLLSASLFKDLSGILTNEKIGLIISIFFSNSNILSFASK